MPTYNSSHSNRVADILKKLIGLQLIVSLLLALLIYLLQDFSWALSGFAGAWTMIAANYSAWVVIKRMPQKAAAKEFITIFIVAEIFKWLTMILFVLLLLPLIVPQAFTIGFIVVILSHFMLAFIE